jgi:hypothetical protein
MNKERDLLPWILGTLAAATVAVGITFVSTGKAVAPISQAPIAAVQVSPVAAVQASPSVLLPSPTPATASAASTEPSPAAVPPAAQLPAPAAESPPVVSGQIWQCTTNGLKTFSNNPCGDKSSLREVSPINTMTPTPVIHYARSYGPDPRDAPAPQYADQNGYADDVNSEPGASDSSGNSYTIVQGIAFAPRRRPEHPHHRDHPDHPDHHNPGQAPRRN